MRVTYVPLGTGLTYAVQWWGAGGGAPIVLVHGFLDLGASWDEVAVELVARFPERPIIAPDLRGHGDSDRIGAGGYYHFFDYVADLDALLDVLASPTVDLVGHSMGGTICSYFAGARPTRVRRLALLEGLGPAESERAGNALPTRAATWLDGWRRVRTSPTPPLRDLDDAVARLRKHDPLVTEARARTMATSATRPGVDGALQWKHDPLHVTQGPLPFRRDNIEPFWRNIACPVLLVDGAATTFRLAADDHAARVACLRDVRAHTLAGAGHMMMRHQPAALATLLGDFLSA